MRVERTHAGLEADARREVWAAHTRSLTACFCTPWTTNWKRSGCDCFGAGPRGLAGMPTNGWRRAPVPSLASGGTDRNRGPSTRTRVDRDPSNRSGEVDRAYLRAIASSDPGAGQAWTVPCSRQQMPGLRKQRCSMSIRLCRGGQAAAIGRSACDNRVAADATTLAGARGGGHAVAWASGGMSRAAPCRIVQPRRNR